MINILSINVELNNNLLTKATPIHSTSARPTLSLNISLAHPLTQHRPGPPTHSTTARPTHSLNNSPAHPLTQHQPCPPSYSTSARPTHSLNISPAHPLTQQQPAHPLTQHQPGTPTHSTSARPTLSLTLCIVSRLTAFIHSRKSRNLSPGESRFTFHLTLSITSSRSSYCLYVNARVIHNGVHKTYAHERKTDYWARQLIGNHGIKLTLGSKGKSTRVSILSPSMFL